MTNKPLTIVARIYAKDEKRTVVKTALLNLLETTRAEKGCIGYGPR